MSGEAVLEIVGAGKSYRGYSSMWWRAAGWFTGKPSHFLDNWVLRDVSLAVRRGEAVGIVGRNGAGKSTLLKLVAGTVAPTEGTIVTRGRVSAILELGMGFNPEFSARDNARHACGLQGYSRAAIDGIMPWIESFSDVGAYFDEPVRTFSSGMTMRVAFAVATALRPDILIVDEALSVGDAAFQRKSFRRIEEFLAHGTSLLFVSHNTESVKRICDQVIWLAGGRMMMSGSSKEVAEAYERDMLGAHPEPAVRPTQSAFFDRTMGSSIEVEYGDKEATIFDVALVTEDGVEANTLPQGLNFSVRYKVRFRAGCRDVHFGMMVKTLEGICVYSTNTALSHPTNMYRDGDVVEVRFDLANNLVPGLYYLNCGVNRTTEAGRPLLHRRVDVAVFRICEPVPTSETGIARLAARASVRLAETQAAA